MAKWGTKDIWTDKGKAYLLQMAALKSKPYVKIGVLQQAFDHPKETDKYPKGTPVTLGEVAIANEFGVGVAGGATDFGDEIFGGQRQGAGSKHFIPERSFIRSTVDAHAKGDWARESEALKKAVIDGMTVDTALKRMGMLIKSAIQAKIRSNVPPPNAPATIDRKGSSKTLIDTGQLLNSIDYEVHREGEREH